MSSSDNVPSILLSGDRKTVFDKIRTDAYSGGQTNVEEHWAEGGNPEADIPYLFLYYFFGESDVQVEQLAEDYRRDRC